jgi:hypothetical protein
LAKIEEKRNVRAATLLTVGTILMVIVAAFFGVPFLIRLAVFWGDAKSAKGGIDKTDLIPPPPPQIVTSFDATNSSVQTISGMAEPGSTIYLTNNTKSVGSVVAKDDGTFSFSDVNLNDGVNTLSAVAVDNAGNRSLVSDKVSITYSNKLPDLLIETPQDRQQISGKTSTIELKGTVGDSVSKLTVNDRNIIVGDDRKFSTTYNLTSGDNTLVFVAADRTGNQTRKEILVTFSP